MADMEEAMNGLEEFDQGDMGPPQTEEHVFIATLTKDEKIFKFEGCDDAESSLILRRATLGAECADESRHVVEVITLDHQDNRCSGTLCSLKLNGACSVSLDGISVAPPTAFKLVKGDGPITICGNLMKEVDPALLPDMDGDSEEEEVDSEEEVSDEDEPINSQDVEAKISEIRQNGKRSASGDDDTDSEVEEPTPAKKPKKQAAKKPEKVEAKVESTKASKKEPKKFANVEELIAAIQSHKGGRPKKKEKFENWIKHTFKVDNKKWISDAWTKIQ